jgi:hypothetical protein
MTERLLMRRVREILRLKYEQRLPHRAIAGMSPARAGAPTDHDASRQQENETPR